MLANRPLSLRLIKWNARRRSASQSTIHGLACGYLIRAHGAIGPSTGLAHSDQQPTGEGNPVCEYTTSLPRFPRGQFVNKHLSVSSQYWNLVQRGTQFDSWKNPHRTWSPSALLRVARATSCLSQRRVMVSTQASSVASIRLAQSDLRAIFCTFDVAQSLSKKHRDTTQAPRLTVELNLHTVHYSHRNLAQDKPSYSPVPSRI